MEYIDINECNFVKVKRRAILKHNKRRSEASTISIAALGAFYNLHSELLNRELFRALENKNEEDKKDHYRVITIAACLFDFTIPANHVVLDSRTTDIYVHIVTKLMLTEVTLVNKNDLRIVAGHAMDRFYPDRAWEQHEYLCKRYVQEYGVIMEKAGGFLISWAQKGVFPTFEAIMINWHFTIPTSHLIYRDFKADDIKSLFTALAGILKIKIPHSYVKYDGLAVLLMHHYVDGYKQLKESHLTLIK